MTEQLLPLSANDALQRLVQDGFTKGLFHAETARLYREIMGTSSEVSSFEVGGGVSHQLSHLQVTSSPQKH